jgi:hypothetical protein
MSFTHLVKQEPQKAVAESGDLADRLRQFEVVCRAAIAYVHQATYGRSGKKAFKIYGEKLTLQQIALQYFGLSRDNAVYCIGRANYSRAEMQELSRARAKLGQPVDSDSAEKSGVETWTDRRLNW